MIEATPKTRRVIRIIATITLIVFMIVIHLMSLYPDKRIGAAVFVIIWFALFVIGLGFSLQLINLDERFKGRENSTHSKCVESSCI